MDSYVPPPPIFTVGAVWRVSVLVTLVWIIGDALDGGSQSLFPPVLVAAWLYVMVVLDRWVTRGLQRAGGDRHQHREGLPELIGKDR
jgi:hypothetical protein